MFRGGQACSVVDVEQVHMVRVAATLSRTPEVSVVALSAGTPIVVPVASIHRKIHTLENFKVLASLGKKNDEGCLSGGEERREILPLSSLRDTPFFSLSSLVCSELASVLSSKLHISIPCRSPFPSESEPFQRIPEPSCKIYKFGA